jgi:hypothetical protein
MSLMRVNSLETGRQIPFLPSLLKGFGGGSFLWPVDIRWKASNQTRLEWFFFSFRTFQAMNWRPKIVTTFK